MLSTMESTRDTLLEAERAAAAPYLAYRPTPWWLAPGVGLLFGVAVFLDGGGAISQIVGTIVLLGGMLTLVVWQSRRHGALPRFGRDLPREFRLPIAEYVVEAVVVLFAGLALSQGLDLAWFGGLVAFIGMTATVTRYEHNWRAAEPKVRRRLGITPA